MALINCRVCKERMSDKAKACPKCGVATTGIDPEVLERGVREQRRERQRKLQMRQMLAMLSFAAGAGLILYAGGGAGALSLIGSTLAAAGFLGYSITRVQTALSKRS